MADVFRSTTSWADSYYVRWKFTQHFSNADLESEMIGLVYADYLDPDVKDTFHRTTCETFQELSRQYPSEIITLTDPNVTNAHLWKLFEGCEFVFYWGHGQKSAENDAVVLGSSQTEYVPVSRIGHELKNKLFFLDACSIASELNDRDYGHLLLICPINSSDYNTSVQMGCTLITSIFGLQMPFDTAFHHAVEQVGEKRLYRLVGTGAPFQISVSDRVRMSLVQAFERLLDIWNRQYED